VRRANPHVWTNRGKAHAASETAIMDARKRIDSKSKERLASVLRERLGVDAPLNRQPGPGSSCPRFP